MQRVIVNYVGTVRDLRSRLAAQMYPEKIVSLEAHRQRKTTSAKVAPKNVLSQVVPFILPDNIA